MRRHSHRWANVGGVESSWRESLDWLQGLPTKLCLGGAATRSLYGQTKALGESLKAGGTTLGHRRCVAWVRSIAQVRVCRKLSLVCVCVCGGFINSDHKNHHKKSTQKSAHFDPQKLPGLCLASQVLRWTLFPENCTSKSTNFQESSFWFNSLIVLFCFFSLTTHHTWTNLLFTPTIPLCWAVVFCNVRV